MKQYNQNLVEEAFKNLGKDLHNLSHLDQSSYIFTTNTFQEQKNRYKHDLITLQKYFKKGRILEVGSSPYHLTYILQKLGYSITGLDINPKEFKSFINKCKLKIITCNFEKEKIPFKDNSFDFIIFNEVLEHLRIDPFFTLKEIQRVLKPGGKLLLTTPNLYALHKIIMFNTGQSFNDPMVEFSMLEKLGYMGHIREYSTNEVKKFLENAGFKIEIVNYLTYCSFYKHRDMQKIYKKIIALIIDFSMLLVPNLRTFQRVLASK